MKKVLAIGNVYTIAGTNIRVKTVIENNQDIVWTHFEYDPVDEEDE